MIVTGLQLVVNDFAPGGKIQVPEAAWLLHSVVTMLVAWAGLGCRTAVTVPVVWHWLLDPPSTVRVAAFPFRQDLLAVQALFVWKLAKARARVVPSTFRRAEATSPPEVRLVLAAGLVKPRPVDMCRPQQAMLALRVPAALFPL